MSGPDWRRGVYLFIGFVVMAPLFYYVAKSLTDSKTVVILASALGGALGAIVGLTVDRLLAVPKN